MPLYDLGSLRSLEQVCLKRLSLLHKDGARHNLAVRSARIRYEKWNRFFCAEQIVQRSGFDALSLEDRAKLLSVGFEHAEDITPEVLITEVNEQRQSLVQAYTEIEISTARLLFYLQPFIHGGEGMGAHEKAQFFERYYDAFPTLKRSDAMTWLEWIESVFATGDIHIEHKVSLLRFKSWLLSCLDDEQEYIELTTAKIVQLRQFFHQRFQWLDQMGLNLLDNSRDIVSQFFCSVAEYMANLDAVDLDRNALLISGLKYEPFHFDEREPLRALVHSEDPRRLINVDKMLQAVGSGALQHTSTVAGASESKGDDGSGSDVKLSDADIARVYESPFAKRWHDAMQDLAAFETGESTSLWAQAMRFCLALRSSSVVELGADVEAQVATNVFPAIARFAEFLDALPDALLKKIFMAKRNSDERCFAWCWFYLASHKIVLPQLERLCLSVHDIGVSEVPGLIEGSEPDTIYCVAMLQDEIYDILADNKNEREQLDAVVLPGSEVSADEHDKMALSLRKGVTLAKRCYHHWVNATFVTTQELTIEQMIFSYRQMSEEELSLCAPEDIFALDERVLLPLVCEESAFAERYRTSILTNDEALLGLNPLRVLVYLHSFLNHDLVKRLLTKVDFLQHAQDLTEKEAQLFVRLQDSLDAENMYRLKVSIATKSIALPFLLKPGVLTAFINWLGVSVFSIYLVRALSRDENVQHVVSLLLFILNPDNHVCALFAAHFVSMLCDSRHPVPLSEIFVRSHLNMSQMVLLLDYASESKYETKLIHCIVDSEVLTGAIERYSSDPARPWRERAHSFFLALPAHIRVIFSQQIAERLGPMLAIEYYPSHSGQLSFFSFLNPEQKYRCLKKILETLDALVPRAFFALLDDREIEGSDRMTILESVSHVPYVYRFLQCDVDLIVSVMRGCEGEAVFRRLLDCCIDSGRYEVVVRLMSVNAAHVSEYVFVLPEEVLVPMVDFLARLKRTDASQVRKMAHHVLLQSMSFTQLTEKAVTACCTTDESAQSDMFAMLFREVVARYCEVAKSSHGARSRMFRVGSSGVNKLLSKVATCNSKADLRALSLPRSAIVSICRLIAHKPAESVVALAPLMPPDLTRCYSAS